MQYTLDIEINYFSTPISENFLLDCVVHVLTKPKGDNPWCSFSGESKPEQQPALRKKNNYSWCYNKYFLF